jgi:hypothetical protein
VPPGEIGWSYGAERWRVAGPSCCVKESEAD